MSAKPAAVEEVSEEAPKKSGNMLMIVLIVLVVVLIAAVGFLAFMMMNQNHGDKPAEHAEAPAAEPYKPEDKAKAYSPSFKQFPPPAPGEDFFLRRGGMAQPYFVYGKPCQRSMRKKDYQEALRTPGISPL